VGCADAVPITPRQVFRRRGEPYAAINGTYWFGEGGTGDPDKGDRPLLYQETSRIKAKLSYPHFCGTPKLSWFHKSGGSSWAKALTSDESQPN
jgi:hypothetical protein